MALILFGGVFTPINLIFWFPHTARDQYWLIPPAVAGVIAFVLTSKRILPHLWPELRPSLFVVIWMVLGVVPMGLYADWKRDSLIREFDPDQVVQNSFFLSIREVPQEFQFFVHAAATKNCVPYIWSYSTMSMVEIKADVAVNVLPYNWVTECKIQRTH